MAPFYLWLPAMDGDVTARGQTAAVDSSVGDTAELLVNDVKFALIGHVEVGFEATLVVLISGLISPGIW